MAVLINIAITILNKKGWVNKKMAGNAFVGRKHELKKCVWIGW